MNKLKKLTNDLVFKLIKHRKNKIANKLLIDPIELCSKHPLIDFFENFSNSYLRTKWFFEFYNDYPNHRRSLLFLLVENNELQFSDEFNIELLLKEALKNTKSSMREAAISGIEVYLEDFGWEILKDHRKIETIQWLKEMIDDIFRFRLVVNLKLKPSENADPTNDFDDVNQEDEQ